MLKVAIVDDEIWACRLVQKLVEWDELGLELAFVENNGENALERIVKDRPDIVITDIRMPVMDGISLLENLAGLDRRPEIIILSGYPDFNYAIQVMKHGASNYLLKPVEKAELNNALSRIRTKIIEDRLFENTQDEIKKKFNDNIFSLREFFFEKLTAKAKIDPNVLRITLDKNRLFGQHANNIVVIARISSNERNNQTFDDDLARLGLGSLFKTSKEEPDLEAFPYLYENKCLYLINFAEQRRASIDEIILDNFQQLSRRVAGSKYAAVFGVSSSYNDEYSVQEHFNEARAALASFLVKQKEQVYFYCSGMADGTIRDCLTAEYEKSIQIHAETLNKLGLISELERVFDVLERQAAERPFMAYQVVCRIAELVFSTIAGQLKQAGLEEEEKAFYLSVGNLDRFADIKNYCITCFDEILTRLHVRRHGNARSLIGKAKDYILKNYEKKISLNDVAEVLYLNPKYFSNLFKKETGVNFVEYVNSVRLDVARSLLRENKYSIGQVAYKVGFTDLRHFSKLFKEHSGVTPKDFKQYQA